MNALDLIVLALAASAALGGYRLGLLARALSWAGMALGAFLAARLLPDLVTSLGGATPGSRLAVAMGVLLAGAFAGQALGLLLGARAHLVLPPGSRPFDRAAGALAGVVGVLAALWLLLPALADVPGEVARQARTSTVGRFVARIAPEPPDAMRTLRQLVGESAYPRVFGELRPSPSAGPPPASSGLAPAVLERAIASTVQVRGPACGRIQEGSGFVVGPQLVATNAHVVAGEGTTTITTASGRRVDGVVVHFDSDRDLALVRAPVDAPPLPLGDAEEGDVGAVLGHPGGGPLRVAPFAVVERVDAVGRDLYDARTTRRDVLILAADLAPGDSGAALVDPDGAVVGVAFAIAPDRRGTSYALAVSELEAALDAPRRGAVGTGPCLAA